VQRFEEQTNRSGARTVGNNEEDSFPAVILGRTNLFDQALDVSGAKARSVRSRFGDNRLAHNPNIHHRADFARLTKKIINRARATSAKDAENTEEYLPQRHEGHEGLDPKTQLILNLSLYVSAQDANHI
jgi:hypothetical protein